MDAAATAQSNLKYDTERVSVVYGFLCSSCQSNRFKRDHPSKASQTPHTLFVICCNKHDSHKPLDSEICWLSDVMKPTGHYQDTFDNMMPTQKKMKNDDRVTFNNFTTVYKMLRPISSSYVQLGLHLGISYHEINEIQANHIDTHRCFQEVLSRWISSGEATWSILLQSLREMNMYTLADRIQMYVRHGF